jgi:tripartite-type tricarboxylate transporter receptor subunit TctC
MMTLGKRLALLLAALAVAASAPPAVMAQSAAEDAAYPAKPVRLIIPWPPGGSNDVLGRLLAQKLSETTGQPMVVENRASAGGILGQELGAKAPPDGYTLTLATSGTMSITPLVYEKLGYDPLTSYELVTLYAVVPYMMVVTPSVEARDVRDFIALAKSKPGGMNLASTGTGSINHLAGELFNLMAGTQTLHVPYKGGGPASIDLMAGRVHLYFASVASMISHVKSGKLRALGVGSLNRSNQLPDVPTLDEQGLKGYDVVSWVGIVAPAGTSHAVVNRLHGEITKIMATTDMRQRLASIGAEPAAMGPSEFRAYLKADLARWRPVIKKVGIKPES